MGISTRLGLSLRRAGLLRSRPEPLRTKGLRFFRHLKEHGLWKQGRATHVFRHSVTACLRANGVSDEEIGPVLGHSPETITGTYGGGYPLGRKRETLLRLDYGVDA